ncbi:MAG: hypothetical protein IJ217_03590 [Clostridia bacterium]|nr:hypothetical protein [Clostridia bacterium]
MCCDRLFGCLLAAFISIFVGIAVGILFFFGVIPFAVIAVAVSIGIAILALIGLVILSVLDGRRGDRCVCMYGNCLLTGIFGTIVTALIALSIILTPLNIIAAIAIAIWAFFFSFLLIALIIFVRCLIDTNCRGRD